MWTPGPPCLKKLHKIKIKLNEALKVTVCVRTDRPRLTKDRSIFFPSFSFNANDLHHSGDAVCNICGAKDATYNRRAVISCRTCQEFLRRWLQGNKTSSTFTRGGNFSVTATSRTSCAPSCQERCATAGLLNSSQDSSHQSDNGTPIGPGCSIACHRSPTATCTTYRLTYHLTI